MIPSSYQTKSSISLVLTVQLKLYRVFFSSEEILIHFLHHWSFVLTPTFFQWMHMNLENSFSISEMYPFISTANAFWVPINCGLIIIWFSSPSLAPLMTDVFATSLPNCFHCDGETLMISHTSCCHSQKRINRRAFILAFRSPCMRK